MTQDLNNPTRLNDQGQEIPDPEPIAITVRNRKIQKFDDVRSFIRRELSEAAARGGFETIDEANDFDIEDDPVDPATPWESWGDEQAEIDQAIAKEKKADRDLAAKRKAAIARRNEQGNTPSNTAPAPPPPSKATPPAPGSTPPDEGQKQ